MAGVGGGILLLVIMMLSGALAAAILPYNIYDIPGMRPANDPAILLFFLSPFVIAFAAAILYDITDPVLKGGTVRKGVVFGLLLFFVITVPNQILIYSSMVYPDGFYLAQVLDGLIGYPLFGVVCAGIWKGGGLEDLKKEIRSL